MNIIKAGLLTLGLGFSFFTHADTGANFCGDAKLNAAHIMRNLQKDVDVKAYVKGFESKYTHPNNAEYYSDTMYLYNLKVISKAWSNYIPSDTDAQKRRTIKSFSEEIYRECINPHVESLS